VRLEVLITVSTKITVFWDMRPWVPVNVFHSTCNLRVVGIKFCVTKADLVFIIWLTGSPINIAHDSLYNSLISKVIISCLLLPNKTCSKLLLLCSCLSIYFAVFMLKILTHESIHSAHILLQCRMLDWHSKVINLRLRGILHSTNKRMSFFFPSDSSFPNWINNFCPTSIEFDLWIMQIFDALWSVTPRCLVIKHKRFGRTCYFDDCGRCLWNKWCSTVPVKRQRSLLLYATEHKSFYRRYESINLLYCTIFEILSLSKGWAGIAQLV